MSWPEEMSFIANSSKIDRHKGKLVGCRKSYLGILSHQYQINGGQTTDTLTDQLHRVPAPLDC